MVFQKRLPVRYGFKVGTQMSNVVIGLLRLPRGGLQVILRVVQNQADG